MLFEIPCFEHVEVTTTDQAASFLREHGDHAAIIAGSTDLLGLLKDKIEGPELKTPRILVNIKPITDLNRITEEQETLRIGAAVTLTRLVNNDLIRKHFPALSQAARQVGTTQIRNMGTLGGNICQRPRCMYFRHPHFICLKKGGKKCFAITGEHRDYHAIFKPGRCVMTHPSDTAPVLVALNAKGVIAGPEGENTVPLREFFADPDICRETVLRPDQFLKEVRIPYPKTENRQIFLKHRVRHSADFALASVAAVAVIANGICGDINLVLGGVSSRPLVAEGAENVLRGRRLDESMIAEAAEAAIEGAKPLPMNRYKIALTRALVQRALALISENA